jgi:hypothetical protein
VPDAHSNERGRLESMKLCLFGANEVIVWSIYSLQVSNDCGDEGVEMVSIQWYHIISCVAGKSHQNFS